MYYRKEIPKSIESALKYHPHWATILPEIEYFNLSEETIETLKKYIENAINNECIIEGGFEQVTTEEKEKILVLIDIKDLYNRKCYSAAEAESVDDEMFNRWNWYKPSPSPVETWNNQWYVKFDIESYMHINDIKKYKNSTDFSVYYTNDGHIFVSEKLGKALEISNLTQLSGIQEEKNKFYVKK